MPAAAAKRISLLPAFASRAELFFGTSLLLVSTAWPQIPSPPAKCPPVARVDLAKDTYGTTIVVDPYRWLEDQESLETRTWIEAEQKCTEAVLSKLPGRAQLTKRLSELLHTDSFEPPVERGGRYFFRKQLASQELFQIYMRRSVSGPDELLVDPTPWSADHSSSAIMRNVSRDGRYLIYGRRDGGKDEITPFVLDVDNKKVLPDGFPAANYFSLELAPGNKTLYYVRVTSAGPRAFDHQMGSNPAQDQVIFGHDLGVDKILVLGLSEDGKYLVYMVIYGSGSEQTDVYLQNLQEKGPAVPVATGEKSLFYPTFAGDQLFILTNWKAPQWRVFSANLTVPNRDHWREVVPEGKVHIESIAAAGGKLVATYTHNASSEVKVFSGDGKVESAIPLPSLGTVGAVSGRWESPELFYSFESYNSSPTIFRYDVKTAKSEVWARDNVPIDSAAFEVEQVWFESKDKARIPMFLFHKKGLKLDGANPVLLYGYGGFDISETPDYRPFPLVWAERGGIYAVVTLREEWHRAGMLEKKQNVFDDFIAAAEYLIANKYTSTSKLSIYGISNGGLLVGAAMTQRPDLYQAVICAYPLLDMLRYQRFLRGPYWVPEYGSADKLEQFAYLYKYSPYQHVRSGTKYPSALFITGDGDTRVAPLHARKMSALLQASTGSNRPILLLYDTKSGHSGGRPVNKRIEEYADILSYLFWQLQIPAS